MSLPTLRSRHALAAAFAVALAGCPPTDAPELRSDQPRNLAPQVPPADASALVDGNTAFAMDLYQQLRAASTGNLFYSPYSASLALAMTWAGARGSTETDMATTLHFTLPQDRLHPAFDALDLALASRGQSSHGANGQPFRLSIANAIWGQQGFAFQAPFLDTLALDYGAGLHPVDFIGAPDGARLTINDWVASETANRIQDLLPPGSVTSDTRLVLTDAVYFNASWATPFDPRNTSDGSFHALDGTTQTASLMHASVAGSYGVGAGWQAIAVPYDGQELSMVVIVPDAGGFAQVEQSLDGPHLQAIFSSLRPDYLLELTMPKWKTEATLDLGATLGKMGMAVAFSPSADFSGIDGAKDLAISDVIQKAWITVDESGTEAAAATAVVIGDNAIPPSATVTLDRPFLYLIRDDATGTVLFVGRVVSAQ